MKQLYVMVATGTAATLLAMVLSLLRVKLHGHRLALTLARRWIATSAHTTGLVLVPLAVIAISCFAGVLQNDLSSPSSGTTLTDDAPPAQDSAFASGDSNAAQDLEALGNYANSIDTHPGAAVSQSPTPNSVDLPDVETMIVKLVTRLEKDPNDVNGWKMLGWSYLNTDRPDEAANAYESALKLDPGNTEIQKALEHAKSAQAVAREGNVSPSQSEGKQTHP